MLDRSQQHHSDRCGKSLSIRVRTRNPEAKKGPGVNPGLAFLMNVSARLLGASAVLSLFRRNNVPFRRAFVPIALD
jgi:hypothetical protein